MRCKYVNIYDVRTKQRRGGTVYKYSIIVGSETGTYGYSSKSNLGQLTSKDKTLLTFLTTGRLLEVTIQKNITTPAVLRIAGKQFDLNFKTDSNVSTHYKMGAYSEILKYLKNNIGTEISFSIKIKETENNVN